jgi:hypothetical protein
MIRRVPCSMWLEADTTAKTLHVAIEAHAAAGEGDVLVHRVNVTASLDADDRRLLRDLFTEQQQT